ncbi:hypothetical protein FNV43_RR23059 [Rhamnella rubrinervis]|uniref:Small EDRK-rich factor-like N-terminal domain-containing protein n=1 Tax=Rhamnella rubrinervis TaxID=2594499 RepID=A0A8K0E328_9ROSA|nr:hypothetical protein FNV43_RR23059 [Rhamnella rubrinervis]
MVNRFLKLVELETGVKHHHHHISLFLCLISELGPSISERGSQRDRDRERAQARAGQKSKQPKHDGLTPEQRRERDAKALQEKTARKAAAQAGNGTHAGGGVKK